MHRSVARWMAVALGLAAVAAGAARTPAQAGTPVTSLVGVDRQTYVVDAPVDPYRNDQLAIHVGAAAGREISRSYLHLSLDQPASGAGLTGANLRLVPTTDNTHNVDAAGAIVEACVLTVPMPATVDATTAAAVDCSKGSSVGKVAADGSWSFDLANLVTYWNGAAGNTGLSVLPVADPSATWTLGFDRTLTGATATFDVPAAVDRSTTPPAPAVDNSVDNTTPVVAGLDQAAPPAGPDVGAGAVDTTNTTAAPRADLGSRSSATRTLPGHRSSAWLWVLLGALIVAALLAGPSVVAVATAGAGKLRETLVAQFQGHARALATSIVIVVWTVTFGVYSVVVAPAPRIIVGTGGVADGTNSGSGTDVTGSTDTPIGGVTGGVGGTVSTVARRGSSSGGTSGSVDASEANLPAAARLYTGADDRIGISNNQITLCGHAALTFGPAFNISASDINVFWQNLNDHGGVFGRKFKVDWKDDSYMPSNAVTAAQACKDEGTFVLLGGIGFDQIPAVRVWAEQNHELYLHHVAVSRGAEGLKYSFSGLPSVEQMGRMFGQLAVQKYRGKKVGILWRNSSNWQPGRDEFRKVLAAAGMTIADDFPVQNNQGTYTQQLVQMKNDGVDVVFAWENAIASTEMLRQAAAQAYHPHWLMFPFNLTLQTVGQAALNPSLDGVAAWPAYDAHDHGGPYASYAADLIEFEREYAQYDPGAKLSGPGGDLLFLAWVGFKQTADLFRDCGADCTRNKFAALMLNGYKKTVTPNCEADFTGGDHHHAAPRMDIFTTVAGSDGKPIWIPTQRCVSSLG